MNHAQLRVAARDLCDALDAYLATVRKQWGTPQLSALIAARIVMPRFHRQERIPRTHATAQTRPTGEDTNAGQVEMPILRDQPKQGRKGAKR